MGQVENGLGECSMCAPWAGRKGDTVRNNSLGGSWFSQGWIQLK